MNNLMKHLLPALAVLLQLSAATFGQGYVQFGNVSLDLTTEKPIMDTATGEYLDSNYVAQLFSGRLGTPEGSLRPVDLPTLFFDPPVGAGLFLGGAFPLPGILVGSQAILQVRVWPALYRTWEAALQAARNDPQTRIGSSPTFTLTAGTMAFPTETVFAMPRFNIATIPEPAPGCLLACGILAFSLSFLRYGARVQ